MITKRRFIRSLRIPLLVGGLPVLAACAVLETTMEGTHEVLDDPRVTTVKVDETFEVVWPAVVAIVEERGYEGLELEQASGRETYRTTVEVEDRPRDKTLRETVTEKQGRIVATTGDGRVVPLELEEQHAWGMTTWDMLDTWVGGDESRTLEHDGVEISVAGGQRDAVHPEETRAVFEAIRQRFGD